MSISQKTAPHHWTVTQTIAALSEKRIGAEELLDHYLDRVNTVGRDVNAVVEQNAELARKSAKAFDNGERNGPLAGLPMTVKDCYDTTGFSTTAGIPDLANHRPTQDADAIARLRAAGAVIYGKTNIPLAASDHQSYNPIYGLTRNPWDHDRSAGGSSGGAAAALAAGLTPLEIGSDIGGSIRIPAHFCGVYGHKPSYGIISSIGHVPPAPGTRTMSPLAVSGPMARCAKDLKLALDVLAGAEGAMAAGWQLALQDAPTNKIKGSRVALWLDGYPLDDTYRTALLALADDLEKDGATVTRLDGPPSPVNPEDDLYIRLLFSVIGVGISEEEIKLYEQAAIELADHPFAKSIAESVRASMKDVAMLLERQAAQIAAWRAFFTDFDVVLAPVSMGQAFPHQITDGHGPLPQLRRTLEINGIQRPYMENLLWPGVATLAHLPSTVRPLPQLVSGLPAGVQIIGDLYADNTTITFAEACDQIFGTSTLAPSYD